MERRETWEGVKLSEERARVCLAQLNVEIEKKDKVENNVIVQGHVTNSNATPCSEVVGISQLRGSQRLLASFLHPPPTFPGAQNSLEFSRILQKLQGSCFNYFLPLGFLQI